MKKAIFMDRDGTISHEVGYINHVNRFSVMDFAGKAIQIINASEYLAIVVTNQAGVAHGYFTIDMVDTVHDKMKRQLAEDGATVDGIYFCPHHPRGLIEEYKGDCHCRKPNTGLLEKAQKDFDIDLTQSYMIGDKISDIELAKRVGAKGIMVMTGYGLGEYTYQQKQWKVQPDYIAENLFEAVKWIISS